MNSDCPVFEPEALLRVEEVYRRQLDVEPSDMVARVSLAWCLFMRALHRAGQESVIQSITLSGRKESVESTPTPGAVPDAGSILKDCLHQTIAVLQLSGNPQDRTDVRRLQSLVRLSGGEQAVSNAEEEAARILCAVTREILEQAAPPRRRVRRMAGS